MERRPSSLSDWIAAFLIVGGAVTCTAEVQTDVLWHQLCVSGVGAVIVAAGICMLRRG